MPKVTLSFSLPEESEDFECARNGSALSGILQEYDNYLRGRLKYEELPEAVHEALQAARDKLHEIKLESGITEL